MISNDNDDFVVITDQPFPYSCKDAKLFFDIAWKEEGSRIVINCRDISRKNQISPNNIKIISITIPEFKGIHNEICAIEPKITSYFPSNFTFETLTIERTNTQQSWFFNFQPKTILEESKVLSQDTVIDIQNYFRAILEICGKEILFNVFFKEENTMYFDDNEAFTIRKADQNILKCKSHYMELLKLHGEFENLQSLTEDLYKQEDSALEIFKEALFEGYFISYNKINEKIELLIEQIQKMLTNRQNSEIGPRVIDEINKSITERINEYYNQQRILINLKLDLSKNLRSLYSNFLAEMLNDQSKYEILIFRDCVGQRMENLSVLYHTENENVCHYNLMLHSADDIIVKRKLQLIHQWEHGQEMTKPIVRHEDYSLIQLKNLSSANTEVSEIDQFYSYITRAYKLLLIYYEARRAKFTNQKQIINDPINIVPPQSSAKSRLKNLNKGLSNENDLNKSFDISQILYFEKHESDDEFEDAMDEIKFEDMKKSEFEKLKLKEDIDNELKLIANIKAELRNSQHQLKLQYDRLIKRVKVSDNPLDSIAFASLHPESKAKQMKKPLPKPGTPLSKEQRLIESRRAAERIKNYNRKLGIIPEKTTKRKTDSSSYISNSQSISTIDTPSQPASIIELPLPLPPPPPPPPLPPIPPPVVQTSQPPPLKRTVKLSPDTKNSKDGVVTNDFLSELKNKMSARKYIDNDIDKQIQQNKNPFPLANNLSLMIDQRRLFIKSNSDSEDDFD